MLREQTQRADNGVEILRAGRGNEHNAKRLSITKIYVHPRVQNDILDPET